MTGSEVWDLVIVGAGPAGASAALGALSLRPRLRVLLLDRSDFPRDKSCGDGIAPHVFDVLARVGVTGLVDDKVSLRTLQIQRGSDSVVRKMARPAWVVPRAVFDARLVEAAVGAGAVLRRHRVRSVVPSGDGVVIDEALTAPVVVGADGAASVVRRAAGIGQVRRRALALRGYAPTPPGRAGRQVIVFGETRQPSYAWSFDRGDGLANVGYGEVLRPAASAPNRRLLQERLDELLPGATQGGSGWLGHHLPLSDWTFGHPAGRILLVGDAAGLVNPMTGEGIYYAVATGVLAGEAAARTLTQPSSGTPAVAYRRQVRSLLRRHLVHTSVVSRLVSVPAVVAAGLRAAARDQRVFDDLVELGLGSGLVTGRTALALRSALWRSGAAGRRTDG